MLGNLNTYKVSWQEVFLETVVNARFKDFMNSVQHSFNIAFPAKVIHKKKTIKKWKDHTKDKNIYKK